MRFKPFLDLLFNCLLGFVFLFVVSFAMVNIENKEANIKTKAEYVITVTWDLENDNDVDSWLRDPQGNYIWFNNKEGGLAHLDRDDLGSARDRITLKDGTTVYYPHNQEILTIRQNVPGLWVFNIHMFNLRMKGGTRVTVHIQKLNPTVETVLIRTIILNRFGQEVTVARWETDSGGDIRWMDYVPVELVKGKLTRQAQTTRPEGVGP